MSLAASYVPPTRVRGCTRLCVQDGFSAPNDGKTPANAAFQAAIDALPASGGTVHVPAGTYLLDPTPGRNLRPRSQMAFECDPGANFISVAVNSLKRSQMVYAEELHDVEWIGGDFIGDLATFQPLAGTTSEWRHIFFIDSCKGFTLRDAYLSGAPGDGISVGGAAGNPTTDLVVYNVVSSGNRRQGLSLVNCTKSVIAVSEFSDTGTVAGTDPRCGVDIEPEKGQVCSQIQLLGLKLLRNARYGLNIEQRSDGGVIDGIDVNECEIALNLSNGAVLSGGRNIRYRGGNQIHHNSATGIRLNTGDQVAIDGNTFQRNYTRLSARAGTTGPYTGWKSSLDRDILRGKVSSLAIGTNTYVYP